jgi:hypothetical protein
MAAHSRSAGRLLAVSLPLYLAWELLQMPFFIGVSADRMVKLAACLLATAMDGLMMLSLLAAGWAAFPERQWYAPPRLGRYAAVSLVGLGLVAATDWLGVYWFRVWGYAPWHPTVFGLGLLALLQPVILVPLSFAILAQWEARARRGPGERPPACALQWPPTAP